MLTDLFSPMSVYSAICYCNYLCELLSLDQMTKQQHIGYCEVRVPGTCPVTGCASDPSHTSGGNDWYCAMHYAEAAALAEAENQARRDENAKVRSDAARAAAETRRLADGSASRYGVRSTRSFASIARGQAKYREIKKRVTERM